MSLKDFKVVKRLGDGSYSKVLQVVRHSDNQVYALKQVHIAKLNEKEQRNAVNEIRILASISHPNVISYKQAFFDQESKTLCIVMEYCEGGDLYQKIQQQIRKGKYMSEAFIWNLVIDMVNGLKALHDLNILHRDLKSANVFLTRDGKAKLGDMNVSKVAKMGLLHTQTGTPYYASPEVWKDVPYDTKSDIWSLGCVIYEAASLKPPFRAEDMKGLYRRVIKGEYPPLPKNFSTDLHEFTAKLLRTEPKLRPSCNQILGLSSITRRSGVEESKFDSTETISLLNTIRLPKSFKEISKKLPKSKYTDSVASSSEPASFKKPPTNLAKFSMISKNLSKKIIHSRDQSHKLSKPRDTSEPPRLKKDAFLRDNYGALKLPRMKYPNSRSRRALSPDKPYKCLPEYLDSKKINGNRSQIGNALLAPK